MKVKFWGTRGSIPSPLGSAEVEQKIYRAILNMPALDTSDPVAVQSYIHSLPPLARGTVGGNTPCVELLADDGTLFILDAGTGIRKLGQELMRGPFGEGRGVAHIFITHTHWDHIQGYPMFDPAFVKGNKFYIYSLHDLETVLTRQQNFDTWPVALDYMPSTLEFVRLRLDAPLYIGKTRISALSNTHLGDAYSYRFEDAHNVIVYATDSEYKYLDEVSLHPHIEFFRNADVVIFDAQYSLKEAWMKEDWGHSSAMIGIDIARRAGVRQLLLFHHDPSATDDQLEGIRTKADEYQTEHAYLPRCQVALAYEGLMLDLTPPGAVDVQLTPAGAAAILTPLQVVDQAGLEQVVQQLSRLDRNTTAGSIIDLSQVKTLDIAGLKMLVSLRQQHKGSAPIVLAAPSESVRRVAELAGYLDYFAIYPTVEAAMMAVQARENLNLRGQRLKGRYQIERLLGDSPLGTTLKATDMQAQQTVAIKLLSPAFSEETLERFLQRTTQTIHLDHPNIVTLLDGGKDGEHIFQVEAYIEAPTLEELLLDPATRPTGEHLMDIAVEISRALEYAHSRGVIHGNLKPANIFVTPTGIKINGFGLGRLLEERNLLEAPFLLVTPEYLAPEQILGQPLDARTDLYALGVVLYEIFTGQMPFSGSAAEVLYAHLRQMPGPPRELCSDLTPSQEHLILKLLAKNPNDRYTSAQQTLRISTSLLAPTEELVQRRALLVGRTEHWQIIRRCWEETVTGRGQLVFITGEPGIGKTSLAQQVAAQSQPPVLLMSDCKESRSNPPYHLFTQVLRAYFNTVPPEVFDQRSRHLLANFTRLVPEIHQMLPDLPQPPAVDLEQEQLRLMTNLTQFIKYATQERPWMLIFDNLQWADTSSLELLRYLGHHLPGMALMIIGIYREGELERGHFLVEMLRDLSGQTGYHHLTLERLGLEDVEQLLTQIWRRPAPIELARRIYEHTEGNPFYIEEIAQGLIDDRIVVLKDGSWRLPELSELRLPQSVHQAVWRRIESLRPDTQTLLSQAAILGQTFRFEDLQEMSGLTRWETLEQLDVALERHLIEEVPGEIALRFRNNEIQQVLYTDLGPLRRRMLHHQAGTALERRGTAPPEQLAQHFNEAGEFDRAVVYALQAAQQAQQTNNNDAALHWYQRTLVMLEQVESGSREPAFIERRITIHQALGKILALGANYNQALDHYATARSLLKSHSKTPEYARQMADLCYRTAKTQETRGDYNSAEQWLAEGLTYLDETQPGAEISHIYNLLGWIRVRRSDLDGALLYIEKSLELARAAGLSQLEADSLRVLGNVYYQRGDYIRAAQVYSEGLRLASEGRDRLRQSALLNNLGNIAYHQGDYHQARAYHQQSLDLKIVTGDRWGESSSLNNLGLQEERLGNFDEAAHYYQQSLLIKEELGDRRGESTTLLNQSNLYLYRYEYTRALACNERALILAQELGDRLIEASAFHQQAIVNYRLGAYRRAQRAVDPALRREMSDRVGESEILGHVALMLLRQDDLQTALSRAQEAIEGSREVGDSHITAFNLTFLGHVLQALEQGNAAQAAYVEAIEMRKAFGQLHLACEPRAGLAQLYLARGAADAALAEVEVILEYLRHGSLEGTYEPLNIYLICYRILHTLDDPRQEPLLATACRLLETGAANISDARLRQSYLERVPAHRELRAAGNAKQETYETRC